MASAHNFEVNQTKIKGGCQSGKKVALHDSKSDLPLACYKEGATLIKCDAHKHLLSLCVGWTIIIEI